MRGDGGMRKEARGKRGMRDTESERIEGKQRWRDEESEKKRQNKKIVNV